MRNQANIITLEPLTSNYAKKVPVCHEIQVCQCLPPPQTGTQIRHLRERKAITLQTIADHASLAIGECFIFTSSAEQNQSIQHYKKQVLYFSLWD